MPDAVFAPVLKKGILGEIMKCKILYPFDTGLELNFGNQALKSLLKTKMKDVVFFDVNYGEAEVDASVYKYGCGLITVTFSIKADIQPMVQLSCLSSYIKIGGSDILDYCKAVSEDIIKKAAEFVEPRYERKFGDVELFPIFIMDKLNMSASVFIHKNNKALYGVVSSESNYEKLSEFVLKQEPLENYGYYEDELIIVKRFGAVISSEEADTICEIIKLVIVRWWMLRSYDYILEAELDEAQKHLADIPSGVKILKTFTQYNKFSRDSLDFSRDNLEIISSTHTTIKETENDWHLNMLYKNISKIFNTEELYKWVEIKIERIEDSYENARDFLSTNFFILLDVIFFLSLVWSIFDTWLLWKISAK